MNSVAPVVKNATFHNNKGDLFTSFNVEDFDIPQGRDEVWQFIPLRRLRGLHDGSFAPATTSNIAVEYADADHDHITVETVDTQDARLRAAGGAVDRVGAQVWFSASEGTVITVKKGSHIQEPIKITITGRGENQTSFGLIAFDIQAGAIATIHVHYVGSGTHADFQAFTIADNAQLTLIAHEDWEDDALHMGQTKVIMGRDSILRHNVACFGGELVRLIPSVKFTAPGADAELLGVYFADDGQLFEQRLLVDHAVAHCRSNVLYKGALQADPESALPEARTSWVGDVLIRAGAEGTDTYEANRNLVLTEGARADAVPNLEIETGNIVGAGHAATVGRFDDEQLFYLRSRGIPEDEARRLIIRGFFSEVIGRIPVKEVREDLENRIAKELENTAL